MKIDHKIETTNGNRILKLDCKTCKNTPSLSKNPQCMEHILENLEGHVSVDKAIMDGKYIREYREKDLFLLKNFTKILEDSYYLVMRKITPNGCEECLEDRKEKVEEIWATLKKTPKKGIEDLYEYRMRIDEESKRGTKDCKICREKYLKEAIEPSYELISKNKLVKKFRDLDKEKNQRKIFNPTIRPRFLRSKLKMKPENEINLVDAYEIGGSKVRIYYSPKKLEHFYFLIPPEYRLPPKKVGVLEKVRKEILKSKGDLDPNLAKKEIEKRSRNLIMKHSLEEKLDLDKTEIDELSKSLAKFTAGLGIVDNFLSDPKVQDIFVDAPVGKTPAHIYHQDFEECLTNVYLTGKDTQILTSRFRAISGRPFSEANPTLDLNMDGVRITAIKEPLSPAGLALAIRRHKTNPWTLPLFVKNGFLTPKAAGLLSLLVDAQASILITGSRGAGKTSLLGALMIEILPKYRILCLEDTSELPLKRLRELGYKTQRLQVEPSISGSTNEMTTEEALRTALRLGESVLIMGEVRGPETKSLYEAMRIGAAGNSVMGTIHGSSTKDVFERVVFDLGISPSSFKATDAIAVASPIRSKGSIKSTRKMTQISEVGEKWKKDPFSEGGFTDLMKYDPKNDEIRATKELINGKSSILRKISKKWSMNFSEIEKNLELRTKVNRTLVKYASATERPELLEAAEVVSSNLCLHRLLEKEIQKGKVDYSKIFSKWKRWLKKSEIEKSSIPQNPQSENS